MTRPSVTCPQCLAPAYALELCWQCGFEVPLGPAMVPCPKCAASMISGSGFCYGCDRLVDA